MEESKKKEALNFWVKIFFKRAKAVLGEISYFSATETMDCGETETTKIWSSSF